MGDDPREMHQTVAENPDFNRVLNEIRLKLVGLPPRIAANMMLTLAAHAMAQQCNTITAAGQMADEAFYQAKQFLLAHFNPISGRKNFVAAGAYKRSQIIRPN